MKAEAMRDMSFEELQSQRALLQKEIFDLRLKKARGETPKIGEQKAKRRDLARVQTVLNEYRSAMQIVDGNEEVAVKALRVHGWDAIATVADLEQEKLIKDSGHGAKVVALAIKLTKGMGGKSDLVRAKNLIAVAELAGGGKDEGKTLGCIADFNRTGMETAAGFRGAAEKALTAANGGVAVLVIRSVLADTRYNLERAQTRLAAVQKLAQETGADQATALRSLQAAGGADLAGKRLKKQAKVAAKAGAKA